MCGEYKNGGIKGEMVQTTQNTECYDFVGSGVRFQT
jgi:hypothetical protein